MTENTPAGTDPTRVTIRGYDVALDRRYDRERHVWVRDHDEGVVRIGMDSLGVETTGDLVELVLQEPGLHLQRGQSFGSLEAAKFVGPLTVPVAGTIVATNDVVVADPRVVSSDPYGDGWLIALTPTDPADLDALVVGGDEIRAWFGDEVERFEAEGVLAE